MKRKFDNGFACFLLFAIVFIISMKIKKTEDRTIQETFFCWFLMCSTNRNVNLSIFCIKYFQQPIFQANTNTHTHIYKTFPHFIHCLSLLSIKLFFPPSMTLLFFFFFFSHLYNHRYFLPGPQLKYGIANLKLIKERFYSPNRIFFFLHLINVDKIYEKQPFSSYSAYSQTPSVINSIPFSIFLFLSLSISGKCVKNISACASQVLILFIHLFFSFSFSLQRRNDCLHSIIKNILKNLKFITLSYYTRVRCVCAAPLKKKRERERKRVCMHERVSASANDASRCAIARHTLSTYVLLLSPVLLTAVAVCTLCVSTLVFFCATVHSVAVHTVA